MQNNSLINLQSASSEEANMAIDRTLMERLVMGVFESQDKPLSARDVMKQLNDTGPYAFEITSIRPRLTELTHKGALAPFDRAYEKESKKRVTRWIMK